MPEAVRALVVEDDPMWQMLLQEILTDFGLEVDVVGTLSAALASIRQTSHRIAVVDLALGNGELNNREGLEVLMAVEQHDPNCVSILLTGYATVEVAVEAMTEYGALTCLRKSAFDRGEFLDWVRRALTRAPVYETQRQRMKGEENAGRGSISEAALPSRSVLVVEDDAGWRNILAELLADADMDYEVRLCNGYGEALGCLRRGTYALVVVDLALGREAGALPPSDFEADSDLGGVKLLARLRDLEVPAIVVSGVTEAETIARLYDQGSIFAYLEKQTFDRRAFMRTVSDVMASASPSQPLAALTPRETEVLTLLAQGMTNRGIAEALVISVNTVKRHLGSIYGKLDVHSRAAATAVAVSSGLSVDLNET